MCGIDSLGGSKSADWSCAVLSMVGVAQRMFIAMTQSRSMARHPVNRIIAHFTLSNRLHAVRAPELPVAGEPPTIRFVPSSYTTRSRLLSTNITRLQGMEYTWASVQQDHAQTDQPNRLDSSVLFVRLLQPYHVRNNANKWSRRPVI
jgi:hypothetical protein